MNWKNRLKNYNFWISLFSAVLLILQAFNIKLDIAYVSEIGTAVLGLLVVIGIISDPTKTSVKQESPKTENNQSTPINKTTDMPTNEKNENTIDNLSYDFKTVFEKISRDLDEIIKDKYMDSSKKELLSNEVECSLTMNNNASNNTSKLVNEDNEVITHNIVN